MDPTLFLKEAEEEGGWVKTVEQELNLWQGTMQYVSRTLVPKGPHECPVRKWAACNVPPHAEDRAGHLEKQGNQLQPLPGHEEDTDSCWPISFCFLPHTRGWQVDHEQVLIFMNIPKVTGLFVEIPLLDGKGSVCLVVSASLAVGCGPGEKEAM